MMSLDALLARFHELDSGEVERWIAERWIVPEHEAGHAVFREVDVARVRLIVELRRDLGVDEEAMPVILALLDQLYGLRRQLAVLCEAVEAQPPGVRDAILARLRERV